jgi:hypothetical protein
MKTSLERRILIFSLLVLTLTVTVSTAFNVDSFRRSYRDSILHRSQTFATALKVQLEAVVNLGLPLEEIDGISARCEEIVQNDPEIAYCLIEDPSGRVLYHSSGDYPVSSTVDYTGYLTADVSILESADMGKLYDYATPIYDYEDKVTGRVRIGFGNEVLDDLVIDHFTSTAMVLAAAFAVVFGLIYLFSRYDLILPIQRLCGMAEDLAAGNFEAKAPALKTRELALLGTTLTGMATALREREKE